MSETFYHMDIKDNFNVIVWEISDQVGFGHLCIHKEQIFAGFALSRLLFVLRCQSRVPAWVHYRSNKRLTGFLAL